MPIPSVYSNVSTHVNRVLTIICFFNVNLKTLHSAGDSGAGAAPENFSLSVEKFLGADRAAGPEGRVLRFRLLEQLLIFFIRMNMRHLHHGRTKNKIVLFIARH